MNKRAQLEHVAKDWCETIRASQVIPVYPLTEDIQPGDVYLVQVPVDRQQEIYRTRGFLPLDNHIARLNPDGYIDFYSHSFVPSGHSVALPVDWMRPGGGLAQAWTSAPNAAFPTYSFTVNRSAGLNLAVPISGIPVGLTALGTDSANGSISIKDARTLGIDTVSLFNQLEAWSDTNRAFLSNFGVMPGDAPSNYLRVVTRVYITGQLDVQLNDARSAGGGADVGLARPVDLFLPTTPDNTTSTREAARASYEQGLAHLNNMASARGTPMYSSGDDSGLSPDELKARAEARAKELETEKAAAKTAQEAKQKAADDARNGAKAEADALRTAQEHSATAQHAVSDAEQRLHEAQAALASLPTDAPQGDRDAATKAVQKAKKALDDANADLDAKNTALQTARDNYKPKAATIAKADVELASAKATLERLQGFAPGGSFRFNAASARSVSLTETFNPPLTIGYLGFDVPILASGQLGRPIPTHAVLERVAIPDSDRSAPMVFAALQDRAIGTYRALAALANTPDSAGQEAKRLKAAIDSVALSMLPSAYPVPIYSRTPMGALEQQIAQGTAIAPGANPYRTMVTYASQLGSSKDALEADSEAQKRPHADLSRVSAELQHVNSRRIDLQHPLSEADAWLNR